MRPEQRAEPILALFPDLETLKKGWMRTHRTVESLLLCTCAVPTLERVPRSDLWRDARALNPGLRGTRP